MAEMGERVAQLQGELARAAEVYGEEGDRRRGGVWEIGMRRGTTHFFHTFLTHPATTFGSARLFAHAVCLTTTT